MISKIYLIRHGITEGNVKRWFYGASDVPLAEVGVKALEEQREAGLYPAPENADYYTSGMGRTEHTFQLIYGDIAHEQIAELQEMNMGEFEMQSYDELKDDPRFVEWLNDKAGEVKAPGGESSRGFADRIMKGWEIVNGKHRLKELSVRHNGKPAESVVVCHGGTISAILENNFPGIKNHFFEWVPDPGHGYELTMKDGKIIEYKMF